MGKRMTAAMLSAVMLISALPALAADSAMETALVSVKGRIDVPAELDVFDSYTYTEIGRAHV